MAYSDHWQRPCAAYRYSASFLQDQHPASYWGHRDSRRERVERPWGTAADYTSCAAAGAADAADAAGAGAGAGAADDAGADVAAGADADVGGAVVVAAADLEELGQAVGAADGDSANPVGRHRDQ